MVDDEEIFKAKMDLMSTYRYDYTNYGVVPKRPSIPNVSLEPDIIGGPFTEYLRIEEADPKGATLEPENEDAIPWKPPTEYYKKQQERIVQAWPHLEERYFSKDLDESVINSVNKDNGRSIYHIDYCNPEDGIVSKQTLKRGKGKHKMSLPDDWAIPRTTVTTAHRHPNLLGKFSGRGISCKRPSKRFDYGTVLTGNTEYQGVISRIGERLLEEKPTPQSYTDRVEAGINIQHVDWRTLDLRDK